MAMTESTRNARMSDAGEMGSGEPGYVHQACDAAKELVSNHPTISVLTAWGIGFSVGMLLGHALAEPPRDERSAITRFGQNMLDAMSQYMPDALSRHFTR